MADAALAGDCDLTALVQEVLYLGYLSQSLIDQHNNTIALLFASFYPEPTAGDTTDAAPILERVVPPGAAYENLSEPAGKPASANCNLAEQNIDDRVPHGAANHDFQGYYRDPCELSNDSLRDEDVSYGSDRDYCYEQDTWSISSGAPEPPPWPEAELWPAPISLQSPWPGPWRPWYGRRQQSSIHFDATPAPHYFDARFDHEAARLRSTQRSDLRTMRSRAYLSRYKQNRQAYDAAVPDDHSAGTSAVPLGQGAPGSAVNRDAAEPRAGSSAACSAEPHAGSSAEPPDPAPLLPDTPFDCYHWRWSCGADTDALRRRSEL